MALHRSYELGMDYSPIAAPIEDILDKRVHDRSKCPVEGCSGEFDYLVLLRWPKSYRWRPDHGLPQISPARDRFEGNLLGQSAAIEQVTKFLEGKSKEEVHMFETCHNCDMFQECQEFISLLICKELNDYSIQWEDEEILLPASHLGSLHSIPGMEAIYNRRVVIGCPVRKARRLLQHGFSISPRGRIARPVIRSDNLRVGYFFVPFENDRERERRRLDYLRGSFPDLASAEDSLSDTSDDVEIVARIKATPPFTR